MIPGPTPPGDAAGALDGRLVAALPGLRRYLSALCGTGGEPDAEDVLQEVVARALRSRERYDRSRSIAPWLRTTALRAFLDLRDAGRRQPRAHDVDPPARAEPAPGGAEELERLLRPLSAIEREVLVRFHQRGERVDEIARALALPAGTVKSHLHRARRRLAGDVPPEATR